MLQARSFINRGAARRLLRTCLALLLLLLLNCWLSLPAFASRWVEQAATVFQHLNTERGLPHPIATALAESADGFLWIGTQGGLARWDGYRFRTYLPNPKDPHSLPDVWVQGLHIDQAKRMWVSTYEGGLAQYDPLQDRFERVPIGPGGLSHMTVWAVVDDGDGGLFIGTDGGLDQYAPDTGGMRHWHHSPSEANSLPDNHVYALLREKNGTLWLGTAQGLARRVAGSSRFENVPLPVPDGQTAIVRALKQSQDGSIWVGTRRNGVFVLRATSPQPKQFIALHDLLAPGQSLLTNKDWIRDISEVRPGEIWFGSDTSGIVVLKLQTMHMRRIEHDLRLPSSLPDNSVSAMLRDRSGMLWVATRLGISRYDPNPHAFLTLYGGSSNENGISQPNIWSILPSWDQRVWLGMGANGVDIFDPEKGLQGAIRPSSTDTEKALPHEIVLSMIQLSEDRFLIGTMLGLFLADGQGTHLQRVDLPGTGGQAEIRSMLRDGEKIWIGTANDGLWQLDLTRLNSLNLDADGVLQRISTDWLAEQRVNVIAAGPAGKLWLAGRDSLILFNPKNRQVEKIKPNPADSHGLASSAITAIVTDAKQRLWLATFGAGIHVLEKWDAAGLPIFHRIGTAEGLPHANINKLLIDKQARVWASTDDGLAMIDINTYAVRKFQQADGVNLTGYWARSGAITKQGELLFGAVGGLTVVRPELLDDWKYQPPVVLTDVQIGGKPSVANRFNLRQEDKTQQEPLVILPNANSLTVEFSALDFTAPQRNRYAYQLLGYDDDWVESDAARRLAAYTNLPPGSYQLKIRASNRNGYWSEQELLIPVLVLPAWHQTWWFRLIQLLLAMTAIYIVLQVRTKYLRQRQQQLESQVASRTAEMQDTNLHLQQANAHLAQSAETLRQLGEVGRDITANLDGDAVFEALHRHVGGLLDTSVLVIYRASEDGTALESGFGREGTQVLPTFRVLLNSPSSNAARAARERQEILLERKAGIGLALPISGSRMLTSLYGPLVVGQTLFGVMSIQSQLEHAYGERERMIFRTLCSYGAIALANAEAINALRQAQAQLVQQEKLAALGGLVAGVAHEVNTPIGNAMLALSGNSNAWQKLDYGLANANLSKSDLQQAISEGLEYTSLALQNIKRSAALITNFQGIAVSFESDQIDEIDLARYLPDVTSVVQADFEQFGHTLSLTVEPGLKVALVTAALTEVLTRILANVLDHGFASGRPGKVELAAYRNLAHHTVDIVISDNGQGIASDALPKVFDPFYTSMSGSGGHVGLGLHVVYNHVTHRLQGRVHIESSLGHGTKVTLALPDTLAQAAPSAPV